MSREGRAGQLGQGGRENDEREGRYARPADSRRRARACRQYPLGVTSIRFAVRAGRGNSSELGSDLTRRRPAPSARPCSSLILLSLVWLFADTPPPPRETTRSYRWLLAIPFALVLSLSFAKAYLVSGLVFYFQNRRIHGACLWPRVPQTVGEMPQMYTLESQTCSWHNRGL